MPDSPDYSKNLPNSVRFPLSDMGELAARLGSPVVLDRRGEVVFIDTFSHGMSDYKLLGSGTGYAVALNAEHIFSTHFNLKLTAGSTVDKYVRITKIFPNFLASTYGIETLIAFYNDFDNFVVSFVVIHNEKYYECGFRFTQTGSKLEILTGVSTWTQIDTLSNPVNNPIIHIPIKVVIDLDNLTYKRLIVSDHNYDISTYPIIEDSESSIGQLQASFVLTGKAVTNSIAYLSYVILTANEP